MSALVVTANGNLKYVDTGGSEVTINSSGNVISAVADYVGNIWALIDSEASGGKSGHASVIYFCDNPGPSATFTMVGGGDGIKASAIAPSAYYDSHCYYLDDNGSVYKTDVKGTITTIFNLNDNKYFPTGIAYSSISSTEPGTVFLLGVPNANYPWTNQDPEPTTNAIQSWGEDYPASAPSNVTLPYYSNPIQIAGGSGSSVLVLDENRNVYSLANDGTAGTMTSNSAGGGIISIGGAAGSVAQYAVGGDPYNAGTPTQPNFTGGNVLLKLSSGTWSNVSTDEGIDKVNNAYSS